MKPKLQKMLDCMYRYNSSETAFLTFGLSRDMEYDALVVAPSYSPYKLKMDSCCKVTTLKQGSYLVGYLVEKDNLKIAWIQISSSDANCIDHIAVCANLTFKKMIFIGAVGALKESFKLGELCIPEYSVCGGIAHTYLKESIRDYVPFEKVVPDAKYTDHVLSIAKHNNCPLRKASVFCTASISLEYAHLDEIKQFDTDLIEMETASFYLMADLLEVPAAALLVVSDNSTTGAALIGRTKEEQTQYEYGQKVLLPKLILAIAKDE